MEDDAMPLIALVCAGLIGWPDDPAPAVGATEYEQVKAAAGRSPEAQIRLALWAEAHGLTAERSRHLALAVLADPANAAARGLLGLVGRQGRWVAPDVVADQVKADPGLTAALAEYDQKRATTPYTADGQFHLGQWADERGLAEQARAHYTAAIRLDPKRDQAWKRLGYRRHDGRWVTEADLATARLDAEAQKQADHHWMPLLERWKGQLARPMHRGEAEANLLGVIDPRAVSAIARVFGNDGPRAVQLLGQIDAPAASRGLAQLALVAAAPDVRRAATETLRRRDPREYANLLIAFINKPTRYEVRPVNGPGAPGVLFVEGEKANVQRLYAPASPLRPTDQITTDGFGQPVVSRVTFSFGYSQGGNPFNPGDLYGLANSYSDSFGSIGVSVGNLNYGGPVRWAPEPTRGGRTAQVADQIRAIAAQGAPTTSSAGAKSGQANGNAAVRSLEAASAVAPSFQPRDFAVQQSVEFSLAQAQAEMARSAQASQAQLDQDVANLERQNKAITTTNDQVVGILNDATGANLPAERAPWERWWINTLGYAFVEGQTQQNPTFVEVVPTNYQPELTPTNFVTRTLAVNGISCFGAGTLVQTLTGARPIEELQVGDLVLTQSTGTGALGYHPVTVTHHNPPSPTFRVKLGDDTVVASHFHRFWIAGRGWVMARDLKPGDPVRTLGDVRAVDAVEAGKIELVYNLDVADDASFFAGASAALVHDNTLPDPRLVPFDLPPDNPRAVAAR